MTKSTSRNNQHMKTMKYFPIIFSLFYLCLLFFCIFARIESWPLSDYRVFEKAYWQKDLVIHMPYFKLSNGKYFNPATKEIYLWIDRVYFHLAFLKLAPDELETYLQKLIHSEKIRRIKKKMLARNLYPVKFVVMKATFKENRKNLWIPVYIPERQYDIDHADSKQ